MMRVLFEVPGIGNPIFGYGLMLAIAFLVCPWLAGRLAARYGIDPALMDSLALWVLIPGLIGARIFFMVQFHDDFDQPLVQFFQVWKGGLVVYGGAIGALIGFLFHTGRHRLNRLAILDILAPVMALGIGIGRIGCLLNGCCYGDYCDHPWGVRFPADSAPAKRGVEVGHHSQLGFLIHPEDLRVLVVEADSDVGAKGLRVGDKLVSVDNIAIERAGMLAEHFDNPNVVGKPFRLTVERDGRPLELTLQARRSLTIHPSQIYSSLSGFVLFALLWTYLPLRKQEGQGIALFAMAEPVTRFLIEFLRFDSRPLSDGLTVSQNVAILLFAAGATIWLYCWQLAKRTKK